MMTAIGKQISLLIMLLLSVTAATAQDGVSPISDVYTTPFADSFLDSLGGDSLSGSPAATQVTITATASKNHALLSVKIPDGWHLYSVTQPDKGPTRTEITLSGATITSIRPLTPPEVEEKSVFGVPVESYAGSVAWHIEFESQDLPAQGKLVGQICNEGLGGVCVQIDEQFVVTDEAVDLESSLAQASSVPQQFWFGTTPTASTTPTQHTQYTVTEFEEVTSLGWAIFWAFLGGIILNVMPCVLPVIGLKILSFFQQAGQSRARALVLNLYYTLGLLTVFGLLAAMSVGLNYLFAFDLFNIIMAVVVFAMALSLMGIWELGIPAFLTRGRAVVLMDREGGIGAYFKGIITTLLAIPCGAPLLSPALSWASVQIEAGQTASVFLVYFTIGLGMASPFLLMGAFPELLRFLPKPGAWMETFRNAMGFFLLVAVVWILSFVETPRVVPTVALLFAIWFACWLFGRVAMASAAVWWRTVLIATLVNATTTFAVFDLPNSPNRYTLEAWMESKLQRGVTEDISITLRIDTALAAGKIVAVDFTADWCLNCKVLDATVLQSNEVKEAFTQYNVLLLHADCTRRDLPGAVLLRSLGGGDSVPALAIFRPESPKSPLVIRGNYTASTLLKALGAK